MNRTLLALPLAAVSALAACAPRGTQHRDEAATSAGGATHAAPPPAAPGVVDPATGLSLAASGARLVDVRTPEEFAEGHLPPAVNIPYDQIGSRVSEVGAKDAPVVLYCRSGRRSAIAAETLRALGFTKVYDARRYDALAQAAQGRPQ